MGGKYIKSPSRRKQVVSYKQYEAIVSGQDTTFAPEELFDFYVETLREKGIVKKPDEFTHLRKFIPMTGLFILVPGTRLSLNELMGCVDFNGKSGRCFFDEGETGGYFSAQKKKSVTDVIETFSWHYLCCDVDDGRAMMHIYPHDAAAHFSRQNRSGYVNKEGIFHVMYFPDVLTHHCMDLPGSRYYKKCIPRLSIYGKRPLLYTSLLSGSFLKRPMAGSASCARRIAF